MASTDLGGEVDHVLADLHGCGVGHVCPGCSLCGAGDRAEQPDVGVGAELGGADRQRDGHEDGLVELPLPRLHGHHPAHLAQGCHVSRVTCHDHPAHLHAPPEGRGDQLRPDRLHLQPNLDLLVERVLGEGGAQPRLLGQNHLKYFFKQKKNILCALPCRRLGPWT